MYVLDNCPVGFMPYETSCYGPMDTTSHSAIDAEVQCAIAGGRIAKIEPGSPQEAFLAYYFEDELLWSGMHRENHTSAWTTSDGLPLIEESILSSLLNATQNEVCAVLQFVNGASTYSVSDCSVKHGHVCQVQRKLTSLKILLLFHLLFHCYLVYFETGLLSC